MITGKPEALKDGEIVVAEIPPELLAQQLQAVAYAMTASELGRKAEESRQLAEATMKLFWAGVRKLTERGQLKRQAEQAGNSGESHSGT
jgi:hypothetical protein